MSKVYGKELVLGPYLKIDLSYVICLLLLPQIKLFQVRSQDFSIEMDLGDQVSLVKFFSFFNLGLYWGRLGLLLYRKELVLRKKCTKC